MSFPKEYRYADLVKAVVGGSFYDNEGIVIPCNRDGNTVFRIETGKPNYEFGFYVNGEWDGYINTDSAGNAIFDKNLPKGEVTVTVIDFNSDKEYKTYVTVREWALWIASYSESLDGIDTAILNFQNNLFILKADLKGLLEYHGESLKFYPNLNQSSDSYRDQLLSLRGSFRNYGTTYKGLIDTISTITQVDPLIYNRRFSGPNWILGRNLLKNPSFNKKSDLQYLPNLDIPGITLLDSDSAFYIREIYLTYVNGIPHIRLGYDGFNVPVSDGEMILYSSYKYTPSVMFQYTVGTVSLTPSSSKLYMNVGGRGVAEIDLDIDSPTYVDADYIAPKINNHFSNNPMYDGTSVGSIGDGGFLSIFADGEYIEFLDGPDNAAPFIFNNKIIPTFSNNEPFVGFMMGAVSLHNAYPLPREISLRRYFDGSDTYVSIGVDGVYGSYSNVIQGENIYHYNLNGYWLQLSCLADLSRVEELEYGIEEYHYLDIYYSAKFNAFDYSFLKIHVDVDNIPLSDDFGVAEDLSYSKLADGWSVGGAFSVNYYPSAYRFYDSAYSAMGDGYSYAFSAGDGDNDPNARFYIMGDVSNDLSILNDNLLTDTYNSSVSPIDYENFFMRFSVSVSGQAVGYASADISFDGGDTWVEGYGVPSISQGGIEVVEVLARIPNSVRKRVESGELLSDLIKVRVALKQGTVNYSPGYDLDCYVFRPNLEIQYITSSYLGNATVSRDRTSIHFGNLGYIWSNEPLSLAEKTYLGLPFKLLSTYHPYAGVEVVNVSSSVPNGEAYLEYKINDSGTVRKIRWNHSEMMYGTFEGWVRIDSDGVFQLHLYDGSYIEVEVSTGLLPETSESTTIIISDERSITGHTREIIPSHSRLDLVDATEYDDENSPMNLFGVITEGDFTYCDLVNLDIADRDPYKYSFLYPKVLRVENEVMELSLAGTDYVHTLEYEPSLDTDTFMILENGIPVPNDMWSITGKNLKIPETYFDTFELSTSSTFTISYDVFYQVTTPVIDLSVNGKYRGYAWMADYCIHERPESEQKDYLRDALVFFDRSTGVALLENGSSIDNRNSKLFVQQASGLVEVSKRKWRFLDDFNLQIDTKFLVDGLYYLRYYEPRTYFKDYLHKVFEHRCGETENDCKAAEWVQIKKNEGVNVSDEYVIPGMNTNYPFHQLRLSVSGARDIRDLKIRSLTIKGLNLNTENPSVEGLTNTWLGWGVDVDKATPQ
jgi:hypothetical protein